MNTTIVINTNKSKIWNTDEGDAKEVTVPYINKVTSITYKVCLSLTANPKYFQHFAQQSPLLLK